MMTLPTTIEQAGKAKQFFDFEGHHIATISTGQPGQHAVIFVHGWLSHAHYFQPLMHDLSAQHHCISFDQIGHGHSDKPRDASLYSIPTKSQQVIALADHLNLDRFSIVGHSMGGQIALYTALHHPERVEHVVNIAGVVTGQLSAATAIRFYGVMPIGQHFPAVWNITRYCMPRFRWYRNFYTDIMTYEPGLINGDDLDAQMSVIRGIEYPSWKEVRGMAASPLTDDLHRIQVPVLTIFGKEDEIVPIENGYLCRDRIPDSQFIELDHCGHSPLIEKTDIVHETIQHYLIVKDNPIPLKSTLETL